MLYAIVCEDNDGSLEARRRHRPAHLQRLTRLKDEGRLFVAGPHPAVDASDPGDLGFTGSLIIAEFPSLSEARNWAEMDPFYQSGVYKNVTVKPFIKVLP